jgi:release factor glutamine methyltransferase
MRKFTAREINHLVKHGFDPHAEYPAEIPIEYITNKVEFFEFDFFVDSNVLIPRPETEQIVQLALKFASDRKKVTFCDIGTGSGAIGLTFASELQKRKFQFSGILSDSSQNALQITAQNAKSLNLNKIVETSIDQFVQNSESNSQLFFLKSDLFKKYPKRIVFDLILANLPYIPSPRMKNLQKSVKDFEPKKALDGGKDGLDLIRKLLKQAPKFLKNEGIIILEVDDTHTKEVFGSQIPNYANWNLQALQDENGKQRFWKLTKKVSQN